MRVPIVSLHKPDHALWLTDDPPHGVHGDPVLIDPSGHVYRPTDTCDVLILKAGLCGPEVYYAAKAAGYQVHWVD